MPLTIPAYISRRGGQAELIPARACPVRRLGWLSPLARTARVHDRRCSRRCEITPRPRRHSDLPRLDESLFLVSVFAGTPRDQRQSVPVLSRETLPACPAWLFPASSGLGRQSTIRESLSCK